MNPREVSNELQRLHQLAKALLGAIAQLQERIDAGAGAGKTVPPPARPTTRIRRVGGKAPVVLADELPVTPRAGGAYHFTTSPKKR